MAKKKGVKHKIVMLVLIIAVVIVSSTVSVAYADGVAAGIFDELNNDDSTAGYAEYPVENYQLDYYADIDLGKLINIKSISAEAIYYSMYQNTNVVWYVNLVISSITGYAIQEAFALDLIGSAADMIGNNLQVIAGVSPSGFGSDGFYLRTVVFLLLILGVYVAYVGMLKHQVSRAVNAVVNFVTVFVLSAVFIAYAPECINKVNDFSSDISTAALSVGEKIVMPGSDGDSVGLMRDMLWGIQVKQPWLMLEFGTTDISSIGEERIDALLSAEIYSSVRNELVKDEVEKRNNTCMTGIWAVSRFVLTVFVTLLNIFISFFVMLLVALMLISQVLFIVYVLFLPISFLLSMIPGNMMSVKKAVERVFNAIMVRAGVVLLVVISFCLSSMVWQLSSGMPLVIVELLQVLVFAAVFLNRNNIVSMFGIQLGESQQFGNHVRGNKVSRMIHHTYQTGARKVRRAVWDTGAAVLTFGKSAVVSGVSKGTKALNPNRKNQKSHTRPQVSSKRTGIGSASVSVSSAFGYEGGVSASAGNLSGGKKGNAKNNDRSLIRENTQDVTTSGNNKGTVAGKTGIHHGQQNNNQIHGCRMVQDVKSEYKPDNKGSVSGNRNNELHNRSAVHSVNKSNDNNAVSDNRNRSVERRYDTVRKYNKVYDDVLRDKDRQDYSNVKLEVHPGKRKDRIIRHRKKEGGKK